MVHKKDMNEMDRISFIKSIELTLKFSSHNKRERHDPPHKFHFNFYLSNISVFV